MVARGAETRLELWVRDAAVDAALPGPEDAIAGARALRDGGAVDGLEVNVWGRHASLSIAGDLDGTAARIGDRVREFERWAVANSRDLRPGFERRERSSFLAEEPHEVVVLPTACLAVYDGGRLRAVYPNHDGSDVHTVRQGLAALEEGPDDRGGRDVAPIGDGG